MHIKILIIATLIFFQKSGQDKLVGSTWNCKITDGCINTLNIKERGCVEEYDCELNYKFKGNYRILKDTLTVIIKDDSHSEDHGKILYTRVKYLVVKNALYSISNGELINNIWRDKKIKPSGIIAYYRSKWPMYSGLLHKYTGRSKRIKAHFSNL